MPGHCGKRRVIVRPVDYRIPLPSFGWSCSPVHQSRCPIRRDSVACFGNQLICRSMFSQCSLPWKGKCSAIIEFEITVRSGGQPITRLPSVTTRFQGGRPSLVAQAFRGGRYGRADGHHEALRSGGRAPSGRSFAPVPLALLPGVPFRQGPCRPCWGPKPCASSAASSFRWPLALALLLPPEVPATCIAHPNVPEALSSRATAHLCGTQNRAECLQSSLLWVQDGRQAARCFTRFQAIMRTLLADVKVRHPLYMLRGLDCGRSCPGPCAGVQYGCVIALDPLQKQESLCAKFEYGAGIFPGDHEHL